MVDLNDPKIIAIEDGQPISNKIVSKFNLGFRDTGKIIKNNKIVQTSNFTGFVVKDDAILVSFPKHYINLKKFKNLPTINEKINHIKLIMNTIISYRSNRHYADYQKDTDINTNFAFEAFNEIYEYYQNYGLYNIRHKTLKKGYRGKIAWKKTISRSNKIVSNGNLLFVPFYVEDKNYSETFITDCMIFAINYTLALYGQFLSMPTFSELAARGTVCPLNGDYAAIVQKLYSVKSRVFKDIHRRLVDNLIRFYQGLDSDGTTSRDIKYYSYSGIWERAVEKYLNKYFSGISQNNGQDYLEFNGNNFDGKFAKYTIKHYDKAHPDNKLEPDHYYLDKSSHIQYIFDSKYYVKLDKLDHKQFVYHALLYRKAEKTYNSLIMPTRGKTRSEIFLDLNDEYLLDPSQKMQILLTHLNTQDVLKNFVK